MKTITSVNNPEIKQIVKLHDSKERHLENKFIIDGVRAIKAALSAGLKLDRLFTIDEHLAEALSLTDETCITLVTPVVMKKMSSLVTATGLLAIFFIPSAPLATKLGPGLVLAQIQDPGNMGTLMRTAVACAVRSFVIIDSVDPWGPKVVQASAGTIAQLDIFLWSWDMLLQHKKDLLLYALVVDKAPSLLAVKKQHSLLIVGNEARGIPKAWQETCDSRVTLPMPGNTESLNAAIAGSLALYITHVIKDTCS
jgi:RNA methyltransferase, TrmH family